MTGRYVDHEGLHRAVRSAVRRALRDAQLTDEEVNGLIELGVADRVADWLRAQKPRAPRLIGATAAAKLLGVQAPHLARLRKQGRMPDPIPVEGSADVYVYEEVEKLARTLRAERAARSRRRNERERAKEKEKAA